MINLAITVKIPFLLYIPDDFPAVVFISAPVKMWCQSPSLDWVAYVNLKQHWHKPNLIHKVLTIIIACELYLEVFHFYVDANDFSIWRYKAYEIVKISSSNPVTNYSNINEGLFYNHHRTMCISNDTRSYTSQ